MPAKQRTKGGRYVPSYLSVVGGEACVVCGDEASGLHYRAMTCEGCKGFFRRSVQKGLRYSCKGPPPQEEPCPVTPLTRNHCAKCRFDKARRVGMATDLVLSEEARSAKRALISENRERRESEGLREALRSLRAADASALPSDQDLHLLHALTASFQHFRDVSPPSSPSQQGSTAASIQDLITPHIKRLIVFANSFPAFASLGADDRFRLVRAAWLELLLFATALNAQEGLMRLPSGRLLRLHPAPGQAAEGGEDGEDGEGKAGESEEERRLGELGRLVVGLELDGTEAGVVGALLLAEPERAGLAQPLEVESAQDQLLTALARYQPTRHLHLLLALAHFRAIAASLHLHDPRSQPLLATLLHPGPQGR